MNSRIKLIAGILVFAAFIGGAAFLYSSLKDKVADEDVTKVTEKDDSKDDSKDVQNNAESSKKKAEDFTVIDRDGNKVSLSDFIGKPVVINFWASWCPPCKSELPDFNEVYQELGEDVKFMMVDMTDGSRETVKAATSYVEGKGFSFPLYFDTEQSAAYAYKIYSIPTTVLVDKDGYVVDTIQGAIEKKYLLQKLEQIMP